MNRLNKKIRSYQERIFAELVVDKLQILPVLSVSGSADKCVTRLRTGYIRNYEL